MIEPSGFSPDIAKREGVEGELFRQKTYLDELFELAPDAVVLTTLRNPRILRINREFTRIFGYTSEEAVGNSLRNLVMPDSIEPTLPEDPDLLAWRKIEREVIRRRKDGTRFHAHITGKRIEFCDDEDAAYLMFRDISARRQAEALLAGEKRLLEVIAAGGPLPTTLDALCRLAEDVDRSSLVSILLLDPKGKQVRHGAGPSLPPSYLDALDGRPVGLGFGPCGAAAHLGEQVISADIAADTRWADDYRALALAHGLRACWSTPIKSSQGRVLGTFALYPSEPASPTPEQRSGMEQLTHLASIAIERAESIDALRRSEERYARAMDAAGDGHAEHIVETDEFYASPHLLEMWGLPVDTTFRNVADFLTRFPLHPGDRDRVIDAINASFASTTDRLELEMLIVRRGETRWHHLTALCSRDATGALLRWNAAITDITARKVAEAALLESEKRYERAMLAADAGFWDWDVAKDEFYVSPRLLEMAGLPQGTTFAGREDFLRRVPFDSEDRDQWQQAVRELFTSGGSRVTREVRSIRNGETVWNRLDGMCVRDESGRVVRWTGSATDVTERKRAEEELRSSEQRYALAMEAAGDGHTDWNLATGEFYASPRLLKILGYPPDTIFTDRDDWVRRFPFHPDDRKRWEAAVADHFAGREAKFKMDLRIVMNGETRWVAFTFFTTRDAAGKVVRWTGSIADIHDAKRDVASLLDAIPGLVAILAPGGEVDGVNSQLIEYCGQPLEAMRQWGTNGTVHSEDLPRVAELFMHAMSTGEPYSFEARIRRFDGAYRWNEVRGLPFRDSAGQLVRWYVVLSDIDARKRAEEGLRSRQEMLEVAQKAARAVAFEWRVGAGAGENRWSPDLEAMYGIPAGSYDGTYESWKKLVHPEDWPKVRVAINSAHESGDVDAEYRVIHPVGAIRWLQAKGRMFFDPEGKPTRVVGFMLDVTDRHLAEEELQRIERQLRQAQRLEALGTLAGGIAHDFNNLLGAILGYGEMALRNVRSGSRLRRDIENVMIAGERGRALVERILAFSRSGVGEQVPVHVEDVARETLALFAAKVPQHIVIERLLHARSAAVMGDPTQIHQVLMNLLTNAVQAMPSGGTLRVSLDRIHLQAPRVVAMGTIAAREYVVMGVSDSGSGIPAEILEKIFDPFFTTKDVGVGTGLGLSLVHGIVTGLDGAIDVETTVGKGSEFKVYLPLAGEVAVPGKPRKRVEHWTRRAGQGRVLVVDDEAALVKLATETLMELGYSAVGLTSSAKAIEAFLADPEQFDAVITDESMPGMSGSELIRKMRTLRPTLPAVLMSGYLSAAVAERAREAGANEVLKKPLSARQLGTALERALLPARR
jgi:PAS domain S-box-containing protein